MSVLCIICARGSSVGIKNKALIKINGKPLISFTIQQAIKSKIFSEIIVSTDSKKIQKVARQYGAKCWFLRPKSISTSNSSKLLAIRHALIESEKYFKKKFNICFDLDITSPLRNISDIQSSYKKFKNGNYTNLFSVNEAKKNPYFNMVEKKGSFYVLSKKTNKIYFSRQKTPNVYDMNASIYIFKRGFLINEHRLFGKKTSIFLMPRERSIDIDDSFDLSLVKYLLKK